jgi:hypothetical protein
LLPLLLLILPRHCPAEFTKSKQAGIDYLYGGELKRMRAPAAPVSVTNPPASEL